MVVVLACLAALSIAPVVVAQASVSGRRVWEVTWRAVTYPDGRVTTVPVLAWGDDQPPAPGSRYAVPRELSVVISLEERLRTAEAARDTVTVATILSDRFFGVDVDGAGRDKTATLEQIGRTEPSAARTVRMSARPADNAVILTGVQTGGAPDRRVFTHVYLRESSGAWKLLSSTTVAAAR